MNRIAMLTVSFFVLAFSKTSGQDYDPIYHPMVIRPDGSCRQFTGYELGHNGDREDGMHLVFSDTTFTKPLRIFTAKDGRLEGRAQIFSKNGILLELGYYNDGLQNGFFYYWNNKGILTKKELYKGGKLIKKWVFRK